MKLPRTTERSHPRGRLLPMLRVVALALCVVLPSIARTASAQLNVTPPELQHVGVNEHLDAQLPLDTSFRDSTGKPVKLRDFFDGEHPVVLTFAYHTCPVLCGMVLNNAAAGLKEVPWTLGKEYRAVTISIDPNESLEKTANKRASILSEYGRAGDDAADKAWAFLVGDEASIAAVTKAAGFEYEYDERQQQWGHSSVVMITTPDGKMARYLYGIEYRPEDLRLGLLEASQGRSISTVEKLIMFCYHYDPQGGKYVLVATRVMQLGGAVVAFVLIGALALLWRREFRLRSRSRTEGNDDHHGPGDLPGAPGKDERPSDPSIGSGEARMSALGV